MTGKELNILLDTTQALKHLVRLMREGNLVANYPEVAEACQHWYERGNAALANTELLLADQTVKGA